MQIFNDKKKRIGTLSGFKDREITTTLDSGDKELSFSYPAAGALVDLLKEEYYIHTKTDEYVIILICGLIVYTELEEHCPELMGDMTDRNTEEFDKEENK